jgi:hypothetical protein
MLDIFHCWREPLAFSPGETARRKGLAHAAAALARTAIELFARAGRGIV